jgi:nucleoside-diphosphate-sugar epimerase
MHIALTGASGFIGSAIARRAVEAGHTVTGLVRSGSRLDHVAPFVDRFVTGDQADESCWPDLLRGAECVIHNSVDWAPLRDPAGYDRHLGSNLLGSLRLLRASMPRQFIFVSTIAVVHDVSPAWHGALDEEHPLRPGSAYGAYKAGVEAHLWAEHFSASRHTSAIRPCGVYGVDPRIERSLGHDLVQLLRAGQPIRKAGGGKWVHVEDVAAAAVAIVGNEAASGRAYNLVDCYARWADWAAMAAEVMGVRAEIDFSSPASPKNVFTKDAARSLGVSLDRGHEGIGEYLRELIAAVK